MSRYKHWMFYDIQAFYRLANGQGNRKDLYQVLNRPQRYLMHPEYTRSGVDEHAMIKAAYRVCDKDWQCQSAVKNIRSFFKLLKYLKGKSPSTFMTMLFPTYRTYMNEYAKFRGMEVSELIDIYKSYMTDAENHDNWKDWGLYIIRYNQALEKSQNDRSGVALSTMHCSKGLEWDHVFIIDCVKDICPFSKAEDEKALEEERRLFYVAMTRAKKHLHLCYYQVKGKSPVRPSPYLKEMLGKEK